MTRTLLIMAGGTGGHVFGSGRHACACLDFACCEVSLLRKHARTLRLRRSR